MTIQVPDDKDDEIAKLRSLIDTGNLPAVFNHCARVYEVMATEVDDDGVWTGSLTKLLPTLNLPGPYYTAITRELKRMGCIIQKRRGGGGSPSLWHIVTPPTMELWNQGATGAGMADATTLGSKSRNTQIEQALRVLNERLAVVEREVKILMTQNMSELIDTEQSDYNPRGWDEDEDEDVDLEGKQAI